MKNQTAKLSSQRDRKMRIYQLCKEEKFLQLKVLSNQIRAFKNKSHNFPQRTYKNNLSLAKN